MLTSKDKSVLKKLQPDFPLSSRPFAVLARQAGISEEEMMDCFRRLRREKILRYIAAMFDMRKLGIVSTLVAMRVPVNKLNKTIRIINAFPNVTHNYLRNHDYNVWFTLSAASGRRLDTILNEIRKRTGIGNLLDLRTEQVFKTRVVFELK